MGVIRGWVPDVHLAAVDGGQPGGEGGFGGWVDEAVGADLESLFVVDIKDGGCHTPWGFARFWVGFQVAVANMTAAGGAEEALGFCPLVDVPCEGRFDGRRRDEVGFNFVWKGGVEATEGSMSVATDAAVAEVDGEWKSRSRDGDGEVR
jgi:hypothetical protein